MSINLIPSAFFDEYTDDFTGQSDAALKHGYKFIELRFINKKNIADLTISEAAVVRHELETRGLGVSAIASPLGKIRLDDDIEAHIEKAKRVYQTAEYFGVKNIRMFSFYAPDGGNINECRSQVIDAVGCLLAAAEDFNVRLCHENEALIYGESIKNCLDLMTVFGGKLRSVFDAGNFVLDGNDSLEAFAALMPYIEYFHIKDALFAGAIVPAGKGEAKISEVLSMYKNSGGKDTFVTLEPHLQTFSGLNVLVGKSFDNPYKYPDQKSAFEDAVLHFDKILKAL